MGQVLLKYRLTPEDASTDMTTLEAKVRAAIPATVGRLSKADIQPFVFGMKVLVVSIIVEDVEGNNDVIEQTLTTLPGVQGADLLDMGRLM